MNRYCLLSVVVFLAFGAVAHAQAQRKTPELWIQIEKTAASIKADGLDRNLDATKARITKTAREIVASSDRTAIEAMIRGASDHLKHSNTQKKADPTRAYSRWIFEAVLRRQTKPDMNQLRFDDVSSYGLAVSAIDNYHDARSRDLLVDLALKDEAFISKRGAQDNWNGRDGSQVFTVYASGILRSYDPQEIKPKIEAAAQTEAAISRRKASSHANAKTREDYLNALLASWKYAASLEPPERDRYRDFERRLWQAWAQADGWVSHKSDAAYYSAAKTLSDNWRDGDDRFLLRIFEEPASTIEETRIATPLTHRFSADAKRRLETIAQGLSSRPLAVVKALEHISRQDRDRAKPDAITAPKINE